jgi:hypothetical protein
MKIMDENVLAEMDAKRRNRTSITRMPEFKGMDIPF